MPQGEQYGLIAQEVEQVFPQLVSNVVQPETRDENGTQITPRLEYKGLNYIGLVPILIGAVKEQQSKIDSLTEVIDSRLAALEQNLARCCALQGTGAAGKRDESEEQDVNRITVELSSLQVIVLEQNVPNPFAEQTTISYFIPDNIGNAYIQFTNLNGEVIKSVDIQKGQGLITVFAPNLSSGIYYYTLIADGKQIETKKLVKSK